MEFQPLQLEYIPLLRRYLQEKRSLLSNYSVGAMVMWRYTTRTCMAIQEDILFLRSTFDGVHYYWMPLGGDLQRGFDLLEQYVKTQDDVLRFTCIDREDREKILARWPEAVTSEGDPTKWGDYVYDAALMGTFAGKRYEKKRNHVNRFKKTYADWHAEEITAENLPKVRDFYRRLCLQKGERDMQESVMYFEEMTRTIEVLDNFDLYGMTGCVLYVGDTVVGFGMGEVIGETMFEHIEKADADYLGAHQMMVNAFVQTCVPEGVKYLNREDDAQDPGLRKSKQSYHPLFLTEKFDMKVAL